MRDHIHKFSVDSLGPKVGDSPFHPFVEIVLQNHSPSINQHVSISPRLVSIEEIDGIVSSLKKDLDRVSRMAKLELEKLKTRR